MIIPASVAVLHIVWKPFGRAVFERFIESYRKFAAGIPHRLVFMFKGFDKEESLAAYLSVANGLPHEHFRVNGCGLDIETYFEAESRIESTYLCFLNSKSVILADGWLETLFAAAHNKSVGLAGATGSWQSLNTNFSVLHRSKSKWVPPQSWLQSSRFNQLRHVFYYPPFPNVHLRTNAFVVKRDVWRRVRHRGLLTRVDVSRFESGRHSLTRQVTNMNMRALLVGRNGESYSPPDWIYSRIFCQSKQENLLIADNQTERYELASADEREFLTSLAWGSPRS